MNIKNLLFCCVAVLLLSACNKDDGPEINPNQLEDDIALIEAYLDENGLTAQKTDSGLHYIVEEEGTGDEFPEEDSDVIIYYKGYMLDGDIFDQQNTVGSPATFNLQGVIPGWTEGVTYFKRGGKGKLFLPSGIAYGTTGSGNIPPNTPIAFDIELVNYN